MTFQEKINNKSILQVILASAVEALPIILGYLPIGFAFGVLAHKAGVSAFNALMMSLLVFAGSAQLIVVGLLTTGIAPVSIIITTFVVNLRHLLMSAGLAPHLEDWRKRELVFFAYELTDETFALHATRLARIEVSKTKTLLINVVSHLAWITGTLLGVFSGTLITDIEPLALDFVLPSMFIGLLVMQIKNAIHIIVALVGGLLSVYFLILGLNQWHVIFATVLSASFGLMVERWMKKP